MNFANSTAVSPKMYETENDIRITPHGAQLLLNPRLADAIDLQLQLKQAHWNVKGRISLACMSFSIKSPRRWNYVDMIAERIVHWRHC